MDRQGRAALAAVLSLFAVVAVAFAFLLVSNVLEIADVGPNFHTGAYGPDSYLIRNARIDTVVSAALFVAAMGSTMIAALVHPGRSQHIITAVVCIALLPLGLADFLALAVAF